MILEKVTVKNWGLHAAFSVELSNKQPLVVLCGDNEVGKSLMGLAVDFGLRGTMSRIGKDRKGLIKTGAKNGQVAINLENGTYEAHLVRDISTGKHMHATANFAELAGNPVLWPMVSSIFAWSEMTADERRKVLFSAFNLPEGVAACEPTLRAEKFSDDIIKQIITFASYELALKHCETKATEARGAWKAITGETYGDVKGVDWSPANLPAAIPTDSVDRLATMRAELQSLNQNIQKEKTIIDQQQGSAVAMKSLNDAFNKAAAAASQILQKVGIVEPSAVKSYIDKTMRPFVENLRQVHQQAQAQYNEQKQIADQLRAGIRIKPSVEVCPCCKVELLRSIHGLQEYIEPDEPKTTVEETADAYNKQLALQPIVEDALNRFNSANQKLEILLNLANAYAALEVTGQTLQQLISGDLLASLTAQRDALEADIESLSTTIENFTSGQKKTNQAKIEHDLVQVWSLMAQWMKPSGCQSLMLSSVLQPVNDRLNTNCQRLGWPPMVLNDDMSITYNGLPYAAASKSGQWRASVVITEAVLHLGGCKSMVVDELDLLAIKSRPAFLKWIHTLHRLGELKRAIIIGTLEAPPKLPAPYNVVWISPEIK